MRLIGARRTGEDTPNVQEANWLSGALAKRRQRATAARGGGPSWSRAPDHVGDGSAESPPSDSCAQIALRVVYEALDELEIQLELLEETLSCEACRWPPGPYDDRTLDDGGLDFMLSLESFAGDELASDG